MSPISRRVHLWLVALISFGAILIGSPESAEGLQPTPQPLNIVLLGDSYSSGTGSGDYYGPDGCYRSDSNWAERYVDDLRVAGYTPLLDNRACNYAEFRHLDDGQVLLNSTDRVEFVAGDHEAASEPQWEQLLGPSYCPSSTGDDKWTFSISEADYDPVNGYTSVRAKCLHTVPPQIHGVGQQTDLVLMTLGGNDGGFGRIVANCFTGLVEKAFAGDCSDHLQLADDYLNDLTSTGFRSELEVNLALIQERLPEHAKVVLLSYPYLSSPGLTTDADAARALGDLADSRAVEAIANVNSQVGHEFAFFVDDVKAKFAGHEPHPGLLETNPDRWIHELWPDTDDINVMYHPNPLGQQAYAEVLAPHGTFFADPPATGDVDVAFVVDATSSMSADVSELKAHIGTLVAGIESTTKSSRFALVTYRDDPAHSGVGSDYSSSVDLALSYNSASFVAAVNAITTSGGGDSSDSVYSGLVEAARLDWRPGVKRIVIQVGDSAPHDPEPGSGLAAEDVLDAVLEAGGIGIHPLYVGAGGLHPAGVTQVTDITGGIGAIADNPQDVADSLGWLIDETLKMPYARVGGPYSSAWGAQIALDARGSHSPDGVVDSYEWDLDGDFVYDLTETEQTSVASVPTDYEGHLILRVTDELGRSSIASTRLLVSEDGDSIPAHLDNCPIDYNPDQGDFDGDGVGDVCDPDPGYRLAGASEPCVSGCVKGSIWGDPHLVSFDGLAYDLQTVGEQVLVESDDGSVVVQTRHEALGASTRVSLVTSVAVSLNDTPVELRKDGSLLLAGEIVELANGQTIPFVGGETISRVGNTYTLGWPGEDENDRFRLDVQVKSNYLNLTPYLPVSLAGEVSGLLGDGDGNPANDLAVRGGSGLSQPVSSSTLYGPYADSWRVTQAESLFTYGVGESAATFTDLDFPSGVLTLADLSANDRALAQAICVGAGVSDPVILEFCVLDVALTGDSTFAEGAIGVPTPALWISDGYFEDFEDGTAPGWSAPVVTSVENSSTRLLGPNAAVTKTLTLSALPPHTQALVSFDVHVVGGWDGDAGPDAIEVKVGGGGPTILGSKTFSNTAATQSYPSSGSAAKTGAVSVDDLGSYGGSGSATYHFETTVAHWQETLTVDFKGIGVSSGDGEFWGVDNVEVRLVRLLPQSFDVTGSTAIPTGTGSGSGNLELPRSEDHYRFNIDSSTKGVFVDRLTCVTNQRFIVLDSNGETVTDRSCDDFGQNLDPGDYTLVVRSTSGATGVYTANLHVVPNDVTATVTPESGSGDAVTVQTSTPGQNGYVTFQASEGDRVAMSATSSYGTGDLDFVVTGPSGQTIWTSGVGFGTFLYRDVKEMPETGTYTVFLDPTGVKTGASTVTVYSVPADVEDTTSIDSTVTVPTGTPGQNAQVTFEAVEGQRVSMRTNQSGYGNINLAVRVWTPSGELLWSAVNNFGSGVYFDIEEMPETGIYTVDLDPNEHRVGASTVILWEVPPDVEDTVTVGGDPVTVDTGTPGQNAYLTFDADEGERVSMKLSQSGYGSTNLTVRVYAPSGSQLWANTGFGGSVYFDVTEMPETGTYTIFIDPENDTTGSATTTLWSVPADVETTTSIGEQITVLTGTPGQNGYVTFDAEAGNPVKLKVAQSGYGSTNLTVRVYKPSGGQLWANTGFGSSVTFGPTTMPETGTYTIYIEPEGSTTGSATITLTPE